MKIYQLNDAINVRGDEITVLLAGGQHHGVATHQRKGHLAEELAGGLAFFQSLAPCQCCRNLLHLSHRAGVESTQSFHGEGYEDETLLATGSSVSLSFLVTALSREAPASAAALSTFEAAKGLVTVTSIAASLPLDHLLMVTSPGLAMVPGSRCLSSFLGPRSAFEAASNSTSRSVLYKIQNRNMK